MDVRLAHRVAGHVDFPQHVAISPDRVDIITEAEYGAPRQKRRRRSKVGDPQPRGGLAQIPRTKNQFQKPDSECDFLQFGSWNLVLGIWFLLFMVALGTGRQG